MTVEYKEIVTISKEEQTRLISEEHLACLQTIVQDSSQLKANQCPVIWDGIACWPATEPGHFANRPCPSYVSLFNTLQNATRECLSDGSWYVSPDTNLSWSNYTTCYPNKDNQTIDLHRPNISKLMQRHLGYITTIYSIGYIISLVSLITAVSIMLAFRRLHCCRNTIHINLFASFIMRAAMLLMKDSLLVEKLGFQNDLYRHEDGFLRFYENTTHWECKLFFSAFHYSFSANYTWILVEGLYLHMLIYMTVFTENSSTRWFILMGWGAPFLSIIPWTIIRQTLDNTYCWNVNTVRGYYWVLKGPIVLTIIVNFVLFVSLVRVLFTKLVAPNAQEAKKYRYRKLAKSTLVLIPLFGVHYILFLWLPVGGISEVAEIIKLYYEMIFNSFQGFFISFLFCFMNSEVQGEIKKKWERYHLRKHGVRGSARFGTTTMTSYVSRARNSENSVGTSVTYTGKIEMANGSHQMSVLVPQETGEDSDHNQNSNEESKLFTSSETKNL